MASAGYMPFVQPELKMKLRQEIDALDTITTLTDPLVVAPFPPSPRLDYSFLLGKGTQTKAEAAKEISIKMAVRERRRREREREEWRQNMLGEEYHDLVKGKVRPLKEEEGGGGGGGGGGGHDHLHASDLDEVKPRILSLSNRSL